jgi:hypothetical protein
MARESADPLVIAQINYMLFLVALLCGNTNAAHRLLKSASDIVRENNIRFVPEYMHLRHGTPGSGPGWRGVIDRHGNPMEEFAGTDFERVSFLASLIRANANLQLLGLAGDAGSWYVELEMQIFNELPVCFIAFPVPSFRTGSSSQNPGFLPNLVTATAPAVDSRAVASEPCDQFTETVPKWRYKTHLHPRPPAILIPIASGTEDVTHFCERVANSNSVSVQRQSIAVALLPEDMQDEDLLRPTAMLSCTAMAILQRILAISKGDSAVSENHWGICWTSLATALLFARSLVDADLPSIAVAMRVRL